MATAFPFGATDNLDLDPRYRELREQPLTRIQMPYGEQAWLATRYADVKIVLGDPRFSRAVAAQSDEPRNAPVQIKDGLLASDPPDHTRLRSLVARAFTARRVELLRPRATEIANELATRMISQGPPADLVSCFAMPLPVRIICEMLGVPASDQEQFRTWTEAFMSTSRLPIEQAMLYRDSLYGYITGLIDLRRRQSTDDLIGALVRIRDTDDDRISEHELVTMIMGLLIAGHETTVSQIPNFVYVLLNHPQEWDKLVSNQDAVAQAVEELLRFVPLSAGGSFARYATEDVEVGGTTVKAGEAIVVSIASANRDHTAFGDVDELDLERKGVQHIAFGHGYHHCIGAPLARMELQVALSTLVTRLPGLRFGIPPDWKKAFLVRGFQKLPVRW